MMIKVITIWYDDDGEDYDLQDFHVNTKISVIPAGENACLIDCMDGCLLTFQKTRAYWDRPILL